MHIEKRKIITVRFAEFSMKSPVYNQQPRSLPHLSQSHTTFPQGNYYLSIHCLITQFLQTVSTYHTPVSGVSQSVGPDYWNLLPSSTSWSERRHGNLSSRWTFCFMDNKCSISKSSLNFYHRDLRLWVCGKVINRNLVIQMI